MKYKFQEGGENSIFNLLADYATQQQFGQPEEDVQSEDVVAQDEETAPYNNDDYLELQDKYSQLEERLNSLEAGYGSYQGEDQFMNFLFNDAEDKTPINVDGFFGHKQIINTQPSAPQKALPSKNGFQTFGSYEEGRAALERQLQLYQTGKTKNPVKPSSTLLEAMSVYAPAADKNNPQHYAKFIADRLGVSVNTPISQIDTKGWADAIEKMEGNKTGNNPGNLRPYQVGGTSNTADSYGELIFRQNGGRTPITVTDKNDPRLRAYNDSLSAYKGYQDDDKFFSQKASLKRLNMNSYYPNEVAANGAAALANPPLNPIGYNNYNYPKNTGYATSNDKLSVPIYKEPVQPVIYQEPNKKPVQPVVYKKSENVKTLSNIKVEQKPTYEDSLKLYNKNLNLKKYPSWYSVGTRDKADELIKTKNIVEEGTPFGKIKPIKTDYWGEGMEARTYKKPIGTPQEPKDYPIVQRPLGNFIKGTITHSQPEPDTSSTGASVFGPTNSLIGHWTNGAFYPADGAQGKVNQADVDLLKNPDALNKYLRSKGLPLKQYGGSSARDLAVSMRNSNDTPSPVYYDQKKISEEDYRKFLLKQQQQLKPSQQLSTEQQKINNQKKINYANNQPNAKLVNGNLQRINQNVSMEGVPNPGSPEERQAKGLDHMMNAADAAGWVMGAGELASAGMKALRGVKGSPTIGDVFWNGKSYQSTPLSNPRVISSSSGMDAVLAKQPGYNSQNFVKQGYTPPTEDANLKAYLSSGTENGGTASLSNGRNDITFGGGDSTPTAFWNKPYESKIDWSKWNKEIPENKALIDEYHTIEQTSKSNGTWMKNPNGSVFQGTPEQFVQQNSQNFKKAFGNSKLINPDGSPTIQYHGSAKKFDTFDENKFQLGDSGYSGQGIYTTPSKTTANSYATSSSKFHKGDIEPTVYELYGQANNPISSSQLIKENKGRDLFNFHRKKNWKGDLTPEESLMDYDAAIADQLPNVERIRPWNDAREIVFPTNKQLKSAVGNNGMFDMSNPNIYKGLIPPVVVAGGATLNKKQYGGEDISRQGYNFDSPYRNEKELLINTPTGEITMENTRMPLLGIDNLGNKKIMKPGGKYKFEGTKVKEMPIEMPAIHYQVGGPARSISEDTAKKNDYQTFYNDYMDSEEYAKRLSGQGYINPAKTIADRKASVNKTGFATTTGRSNSINGNIEVNPQEGSIDEIAAHEYSHKGGSGPVDGNPNLTMTDAELQLFNSLNKAPKNSNEHIKNPYEAKADLDALRYLMKDLKKPNEVMTIEDLNRARELPEIKKSIIDRRLKKRYKDEDILKLLNSIASNNNKIDKYSV